MSSDEPSDFDRITLTAPPRDVAVLHHMRDTGGGFVQALADAWFRADPRNQALLHGAFGQIYQQYRDSLYANAPADVAGDPDDMPLLER